MTSIMKNPKFPKFMLLMYSRGMDIKNFVEHINKSGYKEYNYSIVRKKLKGESALNWDDIRIFSKVMNTDESIFFDTQYTKCKPEEYCYKGS